MSGRVGVSRRFFASSVVGSADMPASEHVPKGASFVTALHAFTQHKLRGDRLGYAWRVDEKAQMEIPLFHYEQPVVHVPMLSPCLSDRFVRIDFPHHTISFLEVLHEGVTEETLRSRWAQHLTLMGFAEADRLVSELENFFVVNARASDRPLLNAAKKQGKSAYLALRRNAELSRSVVVPGDWLTALKTVQWPNSRAAQEKFEKASAQKK